MLCASEGTQLGVAHRRLDAKELSEFVDELWQSRFEFFRSIDAIDIEDARQRGRPRRWC